MALSAGACSAVISDTGTLSQRQRAGGNSDSFCTAAWNQRMSCLGVSFTYVRQYTCTAYRGGCFPPQFHHFGTKLRMAFPSGDERRLVNTTPSGTERPDSFGPAGYTQSRAGLPPGRLPVQRVAIMGATGYIGGRLAPRLLDAGLLGPLPGANPQASWRVGTGTRTRMSRSGKPISPTHQRSHTGSPGVTRHSIWCTRTVPDTLSTGMLWISGEWSASIGIAPFPCGRKCVCPARPFWISGSERMGR
jgi:hypothetical protein